MHLEFVTLAPQSVSHPQNVRVLKRGVLDPDLSAFRGRHGLEWLAGGQASPAVPFKLFALERQAAGQYQEFEAPLISNHDR
ncbi:hypothetical protein [Rhizobium calliandrae]|uniref:hypothetical protein n=1 Tax=Rhizobium calliandrae TaxID=1312182 RepID=UPI0032E4B1F9